MYGPEAGGGLADWSSSGVFCGTGATNISASTLGNVPAGCSRLMTISPVFSLVLMPEMPPFLVFANFSAPTMSV